LVNPTDKIRFAGCVLKYPFEFPEMRKDFLIN